MWKTRVRTCLQTAIAEVVKESGATIDLDATIRTELDGMVRRTQLSDVSRRLEEILRLVEAIPDAKNKRG